MPFASENHWFLVRARGMLHRVMQKYHYFNPLTGMSAKYLWG